MGESVVEEVEARIKTRKLISEVTEPNHKTKAVVKKGSIRSITKESKGRVTNSKT